MQWGSKRARDIDSDEIRTLPLKIERLAFHHVLLEDASEIIEQILVRAHPENESVIYKPDRRRAKLPTPTPLENVNFTRIMHPEIQSPTIPIR